LKQTTAAVKITGQCTCQPNCRHNLHSTCCKPHWSSSCFN